MTHVQRVLGVAERRACRVLGQSRSTQQYQPEPDPTNARLRRRLHVLARRYPRTGYRKMPTYLAREGWGTLNPKRIHRLWHLEGLQVPQRPPKRRPHGPHLYSHLRATGPNHIWSYDFVYDQTTDGRPFRFLTVKDEGTGESLALPAARHWRAVDIQAVLAALIADRGAPQFLRSDNGPEFIAHGLRAWLAADGVRTIYIAPGCPWENPVTESFNSRFREECTRRELFGSLVEAQVVAELYRIHYNHDRPHAGLGYLTPVQYAARVARQTTEQVTL